MTGLTSEFGLINDFESSAGTQETLNRQIPSPQSAWEQINAAESRQIELRNTVGTFSAPRLLTHKTLCNKFILLFYGWDCYHSLRHIIFIFMFVLTEKKFNKSHIKRGFWIKIKQADSFLCFSLAVAHTHRKGFLNILFLLVHSQKDISQQIKPKSDLDYVVREEESDTEKEEIQINLLLAEIIVQFYLIFHCF